MKKLVIYFMLAVLNQHLAFCLLTTNLISPTFCNTLSSAAILIPQPVSWATPHQQNQNQNPHRHSQT
jgi:hypothetical protein